MNGRIYIESLFFTKSNKCTIFTKLNNFNHKNHFSVSGNNSKILFYNNLIQNDINNGYLINDILIYQMYHYNIFFKKFEFKSSSRIFFSLNHLGLISKIKYLSMLILEKNIKNKPIVIEDYNMYRLLILILGNKINHYINLTKFKTVMNLKFYNLDFYCIKYGIYSKNIKLLKISYTLNRDIVSLIKNLLTKNYLNNKKININHLIFQRTKNVKKKLYFEIFSCINKILCFFNYKIEDFQKIVYFTNISEAIVLYQMIELKLRNLIAFTLSSHPLTILYYSLYSLCYL